MHEQEKGRSLIFAMSRTQLVKVLVLLVIAVVCLSMLLETQVNIGNVWAKRGLALFVVQGLVSLLCIPTVFRGAHRCLHADKWLFPLLDGEWEAEIRSNWPRIRKTYEAARQDGPRFNAMADELSASDAAAGVIRAKATIRSSLVSISILIEPYGSLRYSRTKFARPEWQRPEGMPELSYIYEQIDPDGVAPTDSTKHFGAGIVRYIETSGLLVGDYWTQRREDAGFNTAGHITMRRRDIVKAA